MPSLPAAPPVEPTRVESLRLADRDLKASLDPNRPSSFRIRIVSQMRDLWVKQLSLLNSLPFCKRAQGRKECSVFSSQSDPRFLLPRKPIFDQMEVTFEDVTVIFTWEEWKFLDYSQKKLYREVMWENYTNVMSVGNWKESYRPQKERFRYLVHENLSCWQGWNASTQMYENQTCVQTVQGINSKALKQQDFSHYQKWLILSTQVSGYGNYEVIEDF
ncbi:hypothetical protein MUG91_G378n3 [Manis pentadactyla]|nr:hypothetical protein MUG91_G378n3 [Manis pentadactyla]